jgi:hypothetical protein
MTRASLGLLLVTFTTLGSLFGTSEAGDHASRHKDVVLYELNEQARITVDKNGRPHREAASGLAGKARRGTILCTDELIDHAERFFRTRNRTVKDASRCTVVAFGNSNLDLLSFEGTIAGQLYVVVNSETTNLTDAPELVVMEGTFTGTIAVTDPDLVIITITNGALIGVKPATWCPEGCSFTGKFRQPFTVGHVPVYKLDNGHLVRVRPDERALGDPTVRLEVTFD